MFEALKSQFQKIDGRKITSLFADENRATEFSLRSGDILFDYSKTNINVGLFSKTFEVSIENKFFIFWVDVSNCLFDVSGVHDINFFTNYSVNLIRALHETRFYINFKMGNVC